ncbi:unnamed protein product [Paramecium pentaurelia]|uniref:Uncharacterized protein n=1 Tax=Paramecium pentaurelia TaxID=43138 RepID=A0A8S1UZS8_9CILI|nr:unnamed protein product [Paramecium pentaurelia]
MKSPEPLKCPEHTKPLTKICIDEKCDLQPYLCVDCLQNHLCHSYEIQNGIEEFAKKLNVNLSQFEKMQIQFKQLDTDSFASFIKIQKQRVSEGMQEIKKKIMQKCDNLESKLVETLEEQVIIYNKNVQQFKQQLKETEKFQSLQKSSDLSILNCILGVKLPNHNDPINVMRKFKSHLLNYTTFFSSGKIKQLQEQLILLQSQTVFPPTYKNQEFKKNEFNRLINYFDQYLSNIESNIKTYIKSFPITDFDQKNVQIKSIKKEQKLIEEDQCITSFLILQNNLIYALNDMTIKIRDKCYNEVVVIQCETQINCIIEINCQITELAQQSLINKSQKLDFNKQIILALGGDDFTLIWQCSQQSIQQIRKVQHQRMSRVVSLLSFDNLLLIGDWDGQIFGYDLNIQNPLYIVDTSSTILFALVKSSKFIISASKCDLEQGGIIFWNYNKNDLYQEKRIKIQSVQKMAQSNDQLFVVDIKNKLYIYDCTTIELIKSFICSESFVNEIAIDNSQQILYVLNQTCLKSISDQFQWNYQSYEDFPCLQCRQYYQSTRLFVNQNVIAFIRHLHQCKHEQGDDDKCSMKSTLYLMF